MKIITVKRKGIKRLFYLLVAACGILATLQIVQRRHTMHPKGSHYFYTAANYFNKTFTTTKHDKWIIVDYTSSDCEDKIFSSPPEWRWIVIGGTRSAKDCREPLCTIIIPDQQVTKGLTLEGQQLFWQNVAYLRAISQGAVQILEADCRINWTDASRVLTFQSTELYGLLYNSTRHFDPLQYFDAGMINVRNSLQSDLDENAPSIFYLRNLSRVYVLHGIHFMSGNRQVWNKHDGNSRSLRFKPSVPPVFTGQDTFTSVPSSSTLYHQQAFGGLLFPCLTRPMRCAVIRQYILQRLLRELDGFTGFYQVETTFSSKPGNASYSSNPCFAATDHCDMIEHFFLNWECPVGLSFLSCMEKLAVDAVENGAFDSEDFLQVKPWVVSLKAAGFPEPARVHTPWQGVRKVSEILVAVGDATRLGHGDSGTESILQEAFVDNVTSACGGEKNITTIPRVAHWNETVFDDIVLIVVFNENTHFFNNLPYLETIHRPYFRNIVYCVPDLPSLIADRRRHLLSHVTIIEALSDSWYLMYECVTDVATLNIPGVKGYLQIGDDTLVNTWMLQNVSRDALWLGRDVEIYPANSNRSWVWWESSNGRTAILRALKDLETISELTSDEILKMSNSSSSNSSLLRITFSELYQHISKTVSRSEHLKGSEVWKQPTKQEARQFLNNYFKEHTMMGKLPVQTTDFFYIPQNLIAKYITFSRYFMKYRAMNELALVTLSFGIAKVGDIDYLNVRFLWGGNRAKVLEIYNESPSLIALHPLKLLRNMATDKGRDFFCKTYLVNLFTNRSRILIEKK